MHDAEPVHLLVPTVCNPPALMVQFPAKACVAQVPEFNMPLLFTVTVVHETAFAPQVKVAVYEFTASPPRTNAPRTAVASSRVIANDEPASLSASTVTVSPVAGLVAPASPPLDADQWLVLSLQLPAPPTQNLSASN